jgi:prophage DNA circulation protein
VATTFDGLQRASFAGVEYVLVSQTITGGLRIAEHEYPHAVGGDIERLGRKLYRIKQSVIFSTRTSGYPNAWPGDLNSLFATFESGQADDLVIPTVGTMRAICIDWDRVAAFDKMRDGEKCELTFLEDMSAAVVAASSVTTSNTEVILDGLIAAAEALGYEPDLFDSITNAVAQVEAAKEQFEGYGENLVNKAKQLQGAVQAVDAMLAELQDPASWKVVEHLHELGAAAAEIQRDALTRGIPLVTFVTPIEMAASDVASTLYGSTERTVQILKLNPIENAFAIPAGTSLKVYADAA